VNHWGILLWCICVVDPLFPCRNCLNILSDEYHIVQSTIFTMVLFPLTSFYGDPVPDVPRS
jgi:hypothetical protein